MYAKPKTEEALYTYICVKYIYNMCTICVKNIYNRYTKIPDYVDVDILVDLDFENCEKKK